MAAAIPGCHSSSLPAPLDAGAVADAVAPSDAGDAALLTATTCTITPPTTSADWRLSATGTTFTDSLGRVVSLRGVAAGGRSKFAPYVPFDYPDGGYASALDGYIAHAASWGIDVMRVPFTWAALEPTEGTNDADWLSRYDQLLDAAWAHGIWTILDFHQDIYSEVFCGDGFPGWTVPDAGPPHHDCPNWGSAYFTDQGVIAAFDAFWEAGSPVQSKYLAAWDTMVARYKDKPGVLGFEPLNEPGWGSADESTFSATTLTAFYSLMVPRMRAAAPTSLVFVDTPGIDGASVSTSLAKPTGDGIVFAPHYYPIVGPSSDPTTDLVAWQTIGKTWNVPVFVGEFGALDTQKTTPAYMQSVFSALDALSLSGSEWEYSIASEVWNGELFGLVSPDGGELPVAQAIQRPYARAVAGSAIAQAFDPTANTFTLSFTPSSAPGITEVAIPAELVAGGYDIGLAGACEDAVSEPGRILLKPSTGATTVSLTITAK